MYTQCVSAVSAVSTCVYVLTDGRRCLQNQRRISTTTTAHKDGSIPRLIGKRPVADYRHTLFVFLSADSCPGWAFHGCVLFSRHAHTHTHTLGCLRQLLCRWTPLWQWAALGGLLISRVKPVQWSSEKKLIICYCSPGPSVASPSEHHRHLTRGQRCDNGQ